MKLAVIKPSMLGAPSKAALMPLLFALLKPLTPPEVELEFFDENIEPLPTPRQGVYDAVALTTDTFSARRTYQIAQGYRELGIPVIMGGYHPTLCSDEAALHADTVVIGEAEDTWPQILEDLKQGSLKQVYRSSNTNDLALFSCDYTVFEGKRYNPLAVVQYARGCRFSCDFCSVHSFYGSKVRCRPPEQLAQTVSTLSNKLVFFADDNLCASKAQLTALVAALAPLKKRWICQVSMDVAADVELLNSMRAAGCMMVLLGIESLDSGNLDLMGKRANLATDYKTALANIRAAGLMTYGCFVIGYDHDDATSAERICDFALEHQLTIANFNPLIPTPQTPLYQRLKDEGRLLYDEKWWIHPDYRYGKTAFIPARMSPDELAQSVFRARQRFYSRSSTFKRLGGSNRANPTNLMVHLVANSISRREIRTKQYQRLGA